MSNIVVLINVDEEGYQVDVVEVDLYDEEGNSNPLLESPFLVPPNTKSLYKPRWDFEALEWVEGSPEQALAVAKRNKIAEYERDCQLAINSGFIYNGDEFVFSLPKDQLLFTMQLLATIAMPEETGTTITWKTKNNGLKQFNQEEFRQLCLAGKKHLDLNNGVYWSMEDFIEGLTDIQAIESLGNFEWAKEELIKQKQAEENQESYEPGLLEGINNLLLSLEGSVIIGSTGTNG